MPGDDFYMLGAIDPELKYEAADRRGARQADQRHAVLEGPMTTVNTVLDQTQRAAQVDDAVWRGQQQIQVALDTGMEAVAAQQAQERAEHEAYMAYLESIDRLNNPAPVIQSSTRPMVKAVMPPMARTKMTARK